MEAKQKIISFLDKHNNKIDGLELTDFLQDNNIDYMYFADTKELFDYYNEDFDWNTMFFGNVILTYDKCDSDFIETYIKEMEMVF